MPGTLLNILSYDPVKTSYDDVVAAEVARRFRLVVPFGALLLLVFNGLDWAVYPDHGWTFFWIRVVAASIMLLMFALRRVFYRRLLWVADLVVLTAVASIVMMIYLTEGARSSYYQGLNICLLGIWTINFFNWRHALGTGLITILLYLVAAFGSGVPMSLANMAPALFFTGSTCAFISIATWLYGEKHRAEYLSARELAISAAKLDQANRRLRETEELKDRFFANISHELRTPLALILGPVRKYLALQDLDGNLRRDLDVAERNATLLLKHVNDLLDLASLDCGEIPLAYERVSLESLIREVVAYFDAVARERRITLAVEVPSGLTLDADRAKLERVLFNLLSNAVKFVPDGGAISCRAYSDDGFLQVEVADSGPGVPDQLKAVIFDRFRQAEMGDARRFGGTGLGLSIVQEFVQLHRGTVSVSDADLGGALFIARLPLRAPPGVEVRETKTEESDMSETAREVLAASSSKRTSPAVHPVAPLPSEDAAFSDAVVALVVEDNPDMNDFITDTLSQGWRVHRAYDGRSGYQLAKEIRPDIIVTDLMMPDMSGEEMVTQLTQDAAVRHIPVLVLTAYARADLKERLLMSGAHDFVPKPFTANELRARAANLVAMKKARDVLASELSSRKRDLVELAEDLTRAKQAADTALAEAEASSRAKDEFLMNLSHELRTPLTSILGWSELLINDGLDPEEVRQGLEIVERNARVQLSLVNDLLDLSGIVHGKLGLEVRDLDLGDLVEQAVQSVKVKARAKGVGVVTYSRGDALPVRGDAARLRQILDNILSNAVKFTPEGGHIAVNVSKLGDRQVKVAVQDTGEGIDVDQLSQIFEPLWQGDSSTTRRYGGLGLGLAIARRLTELHGGRIEAYSAGKQQGSTMTVILPLSDRPTSEARFPGQGSDAIASP